MAWYLAAPPIRRGVQGSGNENISGADGNRGEIAAPPFSTRHISTDNRFLPGIKRDSKLLSALFEWGGIGRRAAQVSGSMRPTVRNKARSRTKKKKLIEIKQRLEIGFAGIETVFGIGPVSISGQFVSDELGGKIGRNFVRASVWTPPRFLATSDAFSRHYYSPFLLLLAALVSSLFDREHYFFSPFFLCLSLFVRSNPRPFSSRSTTKGRKRGYPCSKV